MKKALITGITGQDGSYLAELLLGKGYEVYGLVRRLSNRDYSNVKDIINDISLVDGDMADSHSIYKVIHQVQPDEVYNLAAQSFIGVSWTEPEVTGNINALGTTRLLEAIHHSCPDAKFYQASTSELFGNTNETPQNENTQFRPRSPYGIAKLYAHWTTINYRESYNMFCCCGILFNHESERRGIEFVTQKVAKAAARIHKGSEEKIKLGNIDAKRDWGYAPDYVSAMYDVLQYKEPTDFVIATGKQHSVRDFIKEAFSNIGIDNFEEHIEIDKRLYRPADVNNLVGDYTKAKELLGWYPKTSFSKLVKRMVSYAIGSDVWSSF
jgi:GDPmannose 4,6-dehydratase